MVLVYRRVSTTEVNLFSYISHHACDVSTFYEVEKQIAS